MFRTIVAFIFIFSIIINKSLAQCAMCRTSLENTVSNGEVGMAAGLNFGILYLFVMPYLAVLIIGYFWYKKSKNNSRKI